MSPQSKQSPHALLENIGVFPKQKAVGSVIWLHGLGADAYDFSDIVPQLNLPSHLFLRFIFPHAPVRPVSIHDNASIRAWYDVYSLTDLRQEDESGLMHMQQSIYRLIEQEKAIAENPNHPVILAGFSQGGAMALYAGLRYSAALQGIIALSSYLPLAQRLMQQAHPANHKVPIWMAHGHFDAVLPYYLGYATYQLLVEHKYSVQWHDYPMAHEVCLPQIQEIGNWLSERFS